MNATANPLILFMAGGTGGHVYPALAVANVMRERGYNVAWLGTDRGIEARVVPEAGIDLHTLAVRGVRGKSLWGKVTGVFALFGSLLQALKQVSALSPVCVVGMGGYAAGPGGVAAFCLRRPLVIHEQNAVAGTTNRLLAPLASKVVAGFSGAFKASQPCELVGNPVRKDLLQIPHPGPSPYDGERPLNLLVLGGSLGALPINNALPPLVAQLRGSWGAQQLNVWHQCGNAHTEVVEAAYAEAGVSDVRVAPFVEDMASAYAWTDVVICRAGALTVAELAASGCPAILVPLPHAIDDHQSANARYLSEAGGGVLLPQAEMNTEVLAQLLQGFKDQPHTLQAMADAARAQALPEAAERVADICEELIRERG